MLNMIRQFTFHKPREILQPTLWLFLSQACSMLPAILAYMAIYTLGEAFVPPYTLNLTRLITFAALGVGCFVLQYIVELISYYFTYGKAYRDTADKRIAYIQKLRRQPLGFFASKESGELISSFSNDFANVEYTLCYCLPYPLGVGALLAISIVWICVYDWRMGLAMFGMLPVCALLMLLVARVKEKHSSRVMEAKAHAATQINEYLRGMKDLKAYAHLTLGMESKDGMSAADILQVRAGQNYLVEDFTRMERLRDDPVVLESLSRVTKEIGFDRVRPYVQENGSYKAMPDMPFSQWENPYFAVDPPEPGDSFSIYQVPAGPEGRDFRFRSYEELQAAGLAVDRKNYELVYTAPLDGKTTLENIYRTFNTDDRPADFRGHSLSVSDVVVINRGGKEEAHYCDSIGFTPVPEFMRENPIKTAEMSTEQNYNMIDGTLNNAPSMGELEAKAKAGEQISLFDVAEAAKAEDKKPKQTRPASKTAQRQKKPSIRAQLKAAKEEQAKKPPAREKSKELEV